MKSPNEIISISKNRMCEEENANENALTVPQENTSTKYEVAGDLPVQKTTMILRQTKRMPLGDMKGCA